MSFRQRILRRLELEGGDETRTRKAHLRSRAKIIWSSLTNKLRSTTTIKRLVNIIFATVVSSICYQQCYLQYQEYKKFDVRLQVVHAIPESPLWLIPGVTICNNNRVTLSALLKESPTFSQKFMSKVPENDDKIDYSEVSQFARLRTIKNIMDDTLNISDILLTSEISRLHKLAKIPVINDINCHSAWNRSYNCENIRLIKSFQGSQCETAFYMGSKYEALLSGTLFEFNHTMMSGQTKVDNFGNYEVAELYVDMKPEEHADLQRDISARLIVHPSTHIGSVNDMAYTMVPGNDYEVMIRRNVAIRLRPPYKSQCRNYVKQNILNIATSPNTYINDPLDKVTCVRDCIRTSVIEDCDCWPLEVPYHPGSEKFNMSGNKKFCPWNLYDQIPSDTFRTYERCYLKNHKKCRTLCQASCYAEDFKIDVTTKPWPKEDLFHESKSIEEMRHILRLKNCCSKVTVKYFEYMETRYIMTPSLSFIQLLSNIGGIVSAFVGLSMVSIYRFIVRKIFHMKVVSSYRRNLTQSK